MRRAVLTLGSTAAGLAALMSFKIHPTTPAADASAAPSASATASPTGATASAGAGSTAQPPRKRRASTRTVTGTVADTQYGPMQVELTLSGAKITKATVLQRTDSGAESDQIDSFAIPKLENETLTAQSASIHAVSGASYTSSGYIQSLQSALDKARA